MINSVTPMYVKPKTKRTLESILTLRSKAVLITSINNLLEKSMRENPLRSGKPLL